MWCSNSGYTVIDIDPRHLPPRKKCTARIILCFTGEKLTFNMWLRDPRDIFFPKISSFAFYAALYQSPNTHHLVNIYGVSKMEAVVIVSPRN